MVVKVVVASTQSSRPTLGIRAAPDAEKASPVPHLSARILCVPRQAPDEARQCSEADPAVINL